MGKRHSRSDTLTSRPTTMTVEGREHEQEAMDGTKEEML